MLRLGILTYDFYPFIGGQGRVTHDLWGRLRQRIDLDVHVMSPARNDVPGHATHFAATQRFGRHPAFSLLSSFQTRRWARDLHLDVLLVNGGPGGVLLLSDPGIPIVYSLYHTYEQVARLTPGQAWKSPLTTLERASYNHSAVITASTPSTARSLRDRIHVRAPILNIPCGVEFDAFPRLNIERDDDLILFVGRLDIRKNPQLLLRAFAVVAANNPTARLAVVGTGPLERSLIELAARHGLEGRVQFQRRASHEELVRWYNRAALVVVPSLFEGFGLSAVEAQSSGACVLATDTEGLRDVVIDGETGVLTPRDAGAMAAAIIELLEDRQRRHALSQAAANHVRRTYDWDGITARYVEAFNTARSDLSAYNMAA